MSVVVSTARVAERRLAEAVDRAGEGRQDWMSCLETLHDAFAADSTIMYAPPYAGRSFVPFVLHKVDLSRIAPKAQVYSTQTPFLDEAVARGLAPGAFFDRDVLPADLEASEHHRDILGPIDWTDGLQFVLRPPAAPEGGLVIKHWRFHPTPRFGEEERQLAHFLFPHLLRATKDKFASPPPPKNAIIPEALNGLSTPFIVLCAAGKPIYLNSAAENLLAKGDVIVSRHGRIDAFDKKASRAFRQAIDQAAVAEASDIEVVLPRANERAPVLGIVSSIAKSSAGGFSGDAAAIAYFVDVESNDGHGLQARRAQVLFALTDAECEVLRLLLDDLSIEEIATQRNSAVATVRTQVKAILQKTRGHRQRDLLRLRRLAI